MKSDKTPKHIKLDERNHVELPLLQQFDRLGWDIIDLTDRGKDHKPADTGRENFTEVILPQLLRSQLKVTNAWLEDDQVEQVVKQLTASFPTGSLIENNKHLLHLLLENTSVSENRQTGENSPTVRFVDFKNAANNNFTAVCQFKIRILGTEHHIIPDITLFLNGLPVVVIECKSPKVKDAIPEAIDQLMRYSEQRGAKGEGSQPLFFYNQFLVATSREAAVRYKEYIDPALADEIAKLEKANPKKLDVAQLKRMTTDVIISGGHNDLPHLKAHSDKSKHEASIKSFKMSFGSEEEGVTGDMGVLIVNNMLLTGFDAPIEQVMYLDKVVVAHNLLQAIARVNRVGGEGKDKGFVIDYVGIGHHLKKAIDIYDEREQNEVIEALSFPEEELRELEASHTEIMALLKKHGLTDLTDHDAFFDVFYDEDLRFDFMLAFKKFTKCLNLLFPAKEALTFMPDYQALNEINILAGKHFRDERLSMKGIISRRVMEIAENKNDIILYAE